MTPSAWFHIQVTPIVLTPSASRPTDDSVGLVSYSGDVSCVDAISFKTSSAWFHIQVMLLVSTPSASRPADDSIGLVSYSGDANIQVTPLVSTPSASRPADDSVGLLQDLVGLVSYLGDASCVDAINFKTYGKLRRSGFIFWRHRLCRCHQLQDLRETMSAWFHHLGTSIMWTPLASRPTNDFVVLVLYSGDVSYVDAISFKTYGKLRRLGFIFMCWNW
ncbi:hypothetical protein Taro_037854 [Colocasia esculenta]|uniref:Uncharacterized protein n=1 Tax=Colocasia esculenta TaxID=4460 RepID=A0A843WE34_COLES|nr:hypothetical protein [Colocasia esculenta]